MTDVVNGMVKLRIALPVTLRAAVEFYAKTVCWSQRRWIYGRTILNVVQGCWNKILLSVFVARRAAHIADETRPFIPMFFYGARAPGYSLVRPLVLSRRDSCPARATPNPNSHREI